ncbi:MAG: polysaccharide deacetylase [Ruminococcaceae bacterium]|nr:polysaccharide deacetylase [Oscillospiraceae bacterium]
MQFKEQSKKKAVTFSYDDGVTQDIGLISLLNKYGLKCTFNLNSGLLGGRGVLHREGKPVSHYKIHKEDVRHIYEGHEIAVHTLTHPNLTALDDLEIIRQVEEDRLNLSELAGYEVTGMAYPCGGVNNDERVAHIIKENTGVKYSRTIKSTESFAVQDNLYRFDPTVFHLNFDKMMELGRRFVETPADKPQLFYIWGHSYELDFESDYRTRLEEFFKLISNRDDIFYGTNKEVLL